MRLFTLTGLAALALVLAPRAEAQCTGTEGVDFQRVTLDEINALPQSQIDALNAGGVDLTADTIEDNVVSPFIGQTIEFTAVILTVPNRSGLASANSEGAANRHHVFVRDTAFDTEGAAGMGGQIVDGTGLVFDFGVRDEVTVCGTVAYFGSSLQITPESMTLVETRGADDPILDPVVITPDVVHDAFDVNGEPRSQVDWDVFSDYLYQFVRFENIEMLGEPGDRPNMLFSTTGEDTSVRTDNHSVCYDNRRQDAAYYAPREIPDCVTDGEFVPPRSGVVNVQGYLVLRSGFDAFNSAVPGLGAFSITPFAPEDFVIAVAPPIVTSDVAGIPSPSAGATIQANVIPGTAGNTVASVVADYTTTGGATGEVDLSNTAGDDFEGTITGLTAGEFVTYTITATDNQGAASTTPATTLRVVDGPVASILDIQVTPDGGPGASTIVTSDPVAFDLDAVVQTAYQAGSRYQATIQDDPSLGPFSGVLMDFGSDDPGLSVGDRITITEARVAEFRDATQLVDVTFTVTGSGDPYAAKVVTTDLFNGDAGDETAEQHEGMLLRFEDVTVTSNNPDANDDGDDFGEFAISSDGTAENAIRVDDAANAVVSGFNSELVVGQELSVVQGYLSYSFGNYKLIPTANGDIAYAVSVGDGPEAGDFRLASPFPNPAATVARVRFELDRPMTASLRLFDVTGREVATLAEGAFGADIHEVAADVGALSSGVYVLRLEAEGGVATARFVIVR